MKITPPSLSTIAPLLRDQIDTYPSTYRHSFEYEGWNIEFSGGYDRGEYWMDEFTLSPLSPEVCTQIINL